MLPTIPARAAPDARRRRARRRADAAPVVHALRPPRRALAPALRDTIGAGARPARAVRRRRPLDLGRAHRRCRRRRASCARRRPLVRPARARSLREPAPGRRLPRPVQARGRCTSFANVAAATQATVLQSPGAADAGCTTCACSIPFTTEGVRHAGQAPRVEPPQPVLRARRARQARARASRRSTARTPPTRSRSRSGSAPPCKAQAPFAFDGATRSFPQLRRDPPLRTVRAQRQRDGVEARHLRELVDALETSSAVSARRARCRTPRR